MSPLSLALPAFLAGILMFLAPCTLPLVPSYLAFIAGVPESDLSDRRKERNVRSRIVENAIAFCFGFSLVFIVFGVFAAAIGSLLGPWRFLLGRAAGVVLIFFGLTMLGLFRLPIFSGEWHPRIPKTLSLGTVHSSFLLGALFALGWSPCIGPILGSILFLASASASAPQGAVLLTIFSFGLSLPFILMAYLIAEASHIASRLASLSRALQMLGGIILIVLGFLILFNDMGLLVSWGFGFFERFGYDELLNYL